MASAGSTGIRRVEARQSVTLTAPCPRIGRLRERDAGEPPTGRRAHPGTEALRQAGQSRRLCDRAPAPRAPVSWAKVVAAEQHGRVLSSHHAVMDSSLVDDGRTDCLQSFSAAGRCSRHRRGDGHRRRWGSRGRFREPRFTRSRVWRVCQQHRLRSERYRPCVRGGFMCRLRDQRGLSRGASCVRCNDRMCRMPRAG